VAAVNVSIVCVAIVGAEVAGQLAYYLRHGYLLVEHDRRLLSENEQPMLEPDPHLVARLVPGRRVNEKGHTITITPQGFRTTGDSPTMPDAVRIAVLGGSTTFGVGTSDVDTWPSRLQADLGEHFAVTNFGVPGFSSAESVVQMALLVPERKPDIIVVYQGWNDLHNFHQPDVGPDYRGHALRLQAFLGIVPPGHPSNFDRFASVSAVAHYAQSLSLRLRHPSELDSAVFTGPDVLGTSDTLVSRLYLRNLRTIRRLAAEDGAFVMFVPQVLDSTRYHGASGSWWTPHVRNDSVPALMRELNGLMRQACQSSDSTCAVADDVQSLGWTHDDFFDEGHFTRAGHEKFARFMESQLRRVASRRSNTCSRSTRPCTT